MVMMSEDDMEKLRELAEADDVAMCACRPKSHRAAHSERFVAKKTKSKTKR